MKNKIFNKFFLTVLAFIGITGLFFFPMMAWADTVTYSYEPNGATGSTYTITQESGTTATFPTIQTCNFVSSSGKAFLGWSENRNATGSDSLISAGSNETMTTNKTFYAIWDEPNLIRSGFNVSVANLVYGGPGVDLSNISYTVSFTPITASNAPATHPLQTSGSGFFAVPQEASISPISFGGWGANTSFQSAQLTPQSADTAPSEYTLRQISSVSLPSAASFGKSGAYEYIVSIAASGGTSTNSAYWREGGERYRLRIYITREAGNYVYEGLAVENITDSQDNLITAEDIERGSTKVNAIEAQSDPTMFRFTHAYQKTQTLTVENTVAGAYARTTYPFLYTVQLTLPDYIDANHQMTYSVAGGAASTATITAGNSETGTHGSATISSSLMHGQSIVISNVPVGTVYRVVENNSVYDNANSRYTNSDDTGLLYAITHTISQAAETVAP